MALLAVVAEMQNALEEAYRDLEIVTSHEYRRGRPVSFKNFEYHGVPAPVITGTVLSCNVKAVDSSVKVYLRVHIDEMHRPLKSKLADSDGDIATINILDPEYDITIIG